MSPPLSWLVLSLLALDAAAAAASAGSSTSEDSLGTGLKLALRLYDECSRRDALGACLKAKAVGFLDRALRMRDIPLGESVRLVRTPDAAAAAAVVDNVAKVFSEADVASLEPEDRDERLDALLLERVARFLNTHTVQLDLPRVDSASLEKGVEEGRGKMKKMMGMMMMGVAMKMAGLIPVAIAGLFLLAGKALIVSKVALVLILVIALKKILAQKQMGGHVESGHGWQGGGGGGGFDRRSFEAHDMAYRGHVAPPTSFSAATSGR